MRAASASSSDPPAPAVRPSSRGFTLIEVIIAIAVISILASMAVPYAAKIIDQSRTEATRKEMEELHRAIVGDPATGSAGFVGDIGRLPARLGELNTRTTPPGPFPPQGLPAGGFLGVKVGWYGPYINTGFDAQGYLNDAWGTPYDYNFPGAGQIRSRGPDRQAGTPPSYGDDIIYPRVGAVTVTGRLVVNLFVWDNTAGAFVPNPSPGAYPGMTAAVTFYYANNGTQTTATAGTPAAPPYAFNSFHSGYHAVSATCTLPPRPAVSGQAVAYVPGNNQQAQLNLYLR